ncbi:hypothetical protein F0562_015391 [Nyssa sinensis]|uniref:Mitotic-spindle organizing protein 1 n=1 Tax=Nyssa sinensis TaxID=561372 RepID=A0A5J4ZL96_9ASTE|nr:hypothetical protein F0562_015391 [Nyssa sinensis]
MHAQHQRTIYILSLPANLTPPPLKVPWQTFFSKKSLIYSVSIWIQEAARIARESLDLTFHMSNILDTGLDRHTLSVLIALCDLGVNPEALAAVVKELRTEPPPSSSMPKAP